MLPKIISQNREEIRVLHVDDDPNQFEFIRFFLNQVDNLITVQCVGTPEEVFSELDTGNYDCLVTDFQMPLMDGIQLSKKIRENHTLPIILYTGQGSEEVAEAAFTIGIDDYLRKEMDPSHYQVLAKRIRNVVEKKRVDILYQRVVEGIRDGVCIIVENEIVYANQVQAEIFGAKSVDQIIGSEPLSYVHEDDLEFAKIRMAQRAKGELDPPFYQYRVKQLNNSILEVEALTNMISYNGKPAFLVLTRDQTEQKRLERERSQVEERFKTIIDLAPDGIVTVSMKGVVTSVNPAFLNITGYSVEEILGKRFYQLGSLRGIDLRNNLKIFASLARGKLPPPVEFVFQFKDGSSGWGEAHLAFIDHNNSKEILAIIRDITERKWVERELNKYSDELKEVIIERKHREEEAGYTSSDNHIIACIGDDIETSLQEIKKNLTQLRADPSKLDVLIERMEYDLDSVNIHLKELFDENLNDLSKKVNVFTLVGNSINELGIPPEVNIEFKYKGEENFRVNPDTVKTAVKNLINNALDGLTDGGEINVLCDSSEASLIIEVKNNGVGLNTEQIKVLSNKGCLETKYCTYSILEEQKIAEAHGGSILISSAEGQGTIFTMVLPKEYRNLIQTANENHVNSKSV